MTALPRAPANAPAPGSGTGAPAAAPEPFDVLTCRLDGRRLIEASAGTGKTWTLCGLYLRMLLELGLEVQQILVLTFTVAATAELRERIRGRIAQVLQHLQGSGPAGRDDFIERLLARQRESFGRDDDDMARQLDLALQTFDEAAIFTIHGFCQRALADVPLSAGVPLAMELMTDDSELRMQVVHDHWRRRLAVDHLPATLAAQLLTDKDTPGRYGELLKRQLAQPLSRVLWPDDLDEGGAGPVDPARAQELATRHAAVHALWAADRDRIIDGIREALPRLNGNHFRTGALDQAIAGWDDWLASGDPMAPLSDKLDRLTTRRLVPKVRQAPPAPHAFHTEAAALLDVRDTIDRRLARSRLRLWRELLTDGPPALRALKRERRVQAFDDLLHDLHQRLTGGAFPALAGALRARFPAALIDEFQDTDPLQYAIIDALYGPSGPATGDGAAPLCLVGDPKQAIYGFRHADLHTYLRARSQAPVVDTLADNQRSVAPLLDGLNALFGANPNAFLLQGLVYPPVRCGSKPRRVLVDRSRTAGPAPAALQVWALPDAGNGQPLFKADAMASAATACAAEIARLIAAAQRGEVTLGEQPLRAGDMAVLVRTHAQGGAMRRALSALGVASVELSQASVFDSIDAEGLQVVLAAVLAPTRDTLVRAALATDLMGRDALAIEALSADEAQWADLVQRFAGWRSLWLQRGAGVMWRRVMADEGIRARLLKRPDGERRLTNLMHLAECLQQAAGDHPAPEALLRWLQTQRGAGRRDDDTQLRLESDRHLVQIVTIHKSKGLEYPIVFCPFLWEGRAGSGRTAAPGLTYHDDAGQPVIDFRYVGGTKPPDALKAQVKAESLAEDLRLVYVALTRAVHRVVMVVGPYCTRTRSGASTTESGRAPLNWLVAGRGIAPSAWLEDGVSPGATRQAWADLAATLGAPAMALEPLPTGAGQRVTMPGPAAADLAALPPPATLPLPWRVGSYSSLAKGASHEAAAADHDTRIEPPATDDLGEANADEDVAVALDDDDIVHFPRGPAAGVCLHAAFEHADFGNDATWPRAIERALRLAPADLAGRGTGAWQAGPASASAPVPASQAAGDATLPRMLHRMLGDVLHTPLRHPSSIGAAFRLAEVPAQRRVVEMEFSLPVQRLDAGALNRMLAAHGYGPPGLAFQTLQGYLRGYIDLMFEHDGRYHLLDWKSNHLGSRPADYGPAPMARAMQQHGYHLQALLYTVALHRLLLQRLPGYRYDRHLGAVWYLFVRGVRPGWVDAAGQPAGVHALRPTLAAVSELSALLGPHADAA